MTGFRRVGDPPNTSTPQPSPDAFAEVLEAIRVEADADSFLGALSAVLDRHGFKAEATKVLRYPSVFCPCIHHERTNWTTKKSSW